MADLLVERLLSEWLAARMADRKFSPTEIRLSECGACPRKRALRALGFEGHPLTEEEAATFEEGNLMEDFLAKVLEERYPGSVQRQVVVPVKGRGLPPCEGHVDFLVWKEAALVEGGPDPYRTPLIVECKTVNRHSASFGLPKQEHVLQVQAYMHFGRFGEARMACNRAEIVYFLKGRRLEWRVYPVAYSAAVGLQVEEELRALWSWVKEGDIPFIPDGYSHDSYPCYWRTASEGTEHFCEMYGHCWDREPDKEMAPPAPEALADTLRRFVALKTEHSRLYVQLEQVREQIKALEPDLVAALGGQAGALQVDGTTVKGTPVKGRITYAIEEAILAGVVPEEALAPYRREGQGYWRWTVTYGKEGSGRGTA